MSLLDAGVLLPKRPDGLVRAKREVRGRLLSNKLFAVVVVDEDVADSDGEEDVAVSIESSSSLALLLLGCASAAPDDTIDPSFMLSL